MQTGPVGSREVAEGGKLELPYAGNLQGRFEDRPADGPDDNLASKGAAAAQSQIAERESYYPEHGDKGYAGSYRIDWKVAK